MGSPRSGLLGTVGRMFGRAGRGRGAGMPASPAPLDTTWRIEDHAPPAAPAEVASDPWDPGTAVAASSEAAVDGQVTPSVAAAGMDGPTQLDFFGQEDPPRGIESAQGELPLVAPERTPVDPWTGDTIKSERDGAKQGSADDSAIVTGVGISEFDPDAHRLWWTDRRGAQAQENRRLRRARQRAAALAGLLDWRSTRERENAMPALVDLFLEYQHSTTFQALRALAERGLDFPTLMTMAELRRAWQQRPEWWHCRHHGNIVPLKNGRLALHWRLAQRICDARCDYDPEAMIDDDWFDEWQSLEPGSPGYLGFLQYIADKVGSELTEALHEGLRQFSRYRGTEELHERRRGGQRLNDLMRDSGVRINYVYRNANDSAAEAADGAAR